MPVEHEIKLPFDTVDAARHAVSAAGGRLDVPRRLIDDRLFDTEDGRLGGRGGTLRVRRDGTGGFITFKGPVQPGAVKSREEIETSVGSADVAETIVLALGFRRVFHAEKYREEYLIGNARVTIDETPIGVFVEIEAAPALIDVTAARLGRGRDDYRLDSYPSLYVAWCRARGLTPGDMTFGSVRDRA